MKLQALVSFALCGSLSFVGVRAQGTPDSLHVEAAAVRAEVARSLAGLREYTWTEQTQVSVKGDIKSESAARCRYNSAGELRKTPAGASEDEKSANGISKRPVVRKKANIQDYIERAVSMIQEYVPPKPELVDFALNNARASVRKGADGNSEIELKSYYQNGDSVVYTYDPSTKRLLRAMVSSALGGPKDPVTLEAIFETLPDGVNHVASTTLSATNKKVQIKTKNVAYQKAS